MARSLRSLAVAITASSALLRVILFTALVVGTALASSPVGAAGFDYALDELRVTGNLAFFDDFEDGSRSSPPTSAFVDWRTTVTVEEGGFLILDSENGSYPRPDLGVDLNWIQGFVDLAPPIPDGGTGTTTVSASCRPDVPEAGYDGVPGDSMFAHYGIVLGSDTAGEDFVELLVGEFGGRLRITFADSRSTPTSLGVDLPRFSSITGNIVLELDIDHASDTVMPRYSLDGGTSFVEGADWLVPTQPGLVFDTRNETFAGFYAFGSAPEPGAGASAAAALATLGGIARLRRQRGSR